MMPSDETLAVTLALSGGGIAAMGHIVVLQAMEELGLKPDAIAGTSMGAAIGVCHGAGMSGAEIEDHVRAVARNRGARFRRFLTTGWTGLPKGTLDPEHLLRTILPEGLPETLAELPLPVTVVATDFRAREPVAFRKEDTLKALAASIAVPGLFRPVHWNGRDYVDGGICNNLPVDVLPESAATIAADVGMRSGRGERPLPSTIGMVTEAVRIMMHSMTRSRLALRENVTLIQPSLRVVGVLEVHRIEEVLDQAHDEMDDLKRQLETILR